MVDKTPHSAFFPSNVGKFCICPWISWRLLTFLAKNMTHSTFWTSCHDQSALPILHCISPSTNSPLWSISEYTVLMGEIDGPSTGRVDPVRGCLNNPIHLGWPTLTSLAAPLADLSPKKTKENYSKLTNLNDKK